MFTGLIQNLGELTQLNGGRLCVKTPSAGKISLGDSIAVNGVCLTAVKTGPDFFEADLSPETLARTTFSKIAAPKKVNLEAPLTASQALGGHLVQGHVDGVGSVSAIRPEKDSYRIDFSFPPELAPFLVAKGSVAIDGISLTVNTVEASSFSVMIIPHTWAVTNMQYYSVGDSVNLEVDIFAKYIHRAFQLYQKPEMRPS